MEQEDRTTQHEVTTSTTAVTQDTSSNSELNWEFLAVLDSAGMKCKIKASDIIGIVTPIIRPDSGPESDSKLHFSTSPI